MIIKWWYQLLGGIIVLLSLNSCGFHVHQQLPIELMHIAIISDNPNGHLSQQLRRIFRGNPIQMVNESNQAPITLHLFDENTITQILSESASSATRQYTLRYSVGYEIQGHNNIIYGPKYLNATQNYTVNERQVLSVTTEQHILKDQLQRELIRQLISQLESPQVQQLIHQYHKLDHEN